jgi:hypothetical protein
MIVRGGSACVTAMGEGDVVAEVKTAGTRRRAVGTRDRIMSHLAMTGEISDEGGMASTLLAKEVGYPGSSIAFAQLLSGMERSGLIRREVRGKRTYRITAVPGSATRLVSAGEHKPMSRAGAPAGLDYDELARRLLVQVVRELAGARRELTRQGGLVQDSPDGQGNGWQAGRDNGTLPHPARTLDDARPAQPAGQAADAQPDGQAGPGGSAADALPGGHDGALAGALPTGQAAGDGQAGEPGPVAVQGAPPSLEGKLADLQRELVSTREMHNTVTAENARLREQLRATRRSLARLRGRATRRPVTEDLDADETGLLDHLLAPTGKPSDSDEPAAQ